MHFPKTIARYAKALSNSTGSAVAAEPVYTLTVPGTEDEAVDEEQGSPDVEEWDDIDDGADTVDESDDDADC